MEDPTERRPHVGTYIAMFLPLIVFIVILSGSGSFFLLFIFFLILALPAVAAANAAQERQRQVDMEAFEQQRQAQMRFLVSSTAHGGPTALYRPEGGVMPVIVFPALPAEAAAAGGTLGANGTTTVAVGLPLEVQRPQLQQQQTSSAPASPGHGTSNGDAEDYGSAEYAPAMAGYASTYTVVIAEDEAEGKKKNTAREEQLADSATSPHSAPHTPTGKCP